VIFDHIFTNYVGKTKSDYFYTDGFTRYHRFKFRAQNGMSEKDVASANNVYKVYGYGSNIYNLEI